MELESKSTNLTKVIVYLHIASQRGDSNSIFLYARNLQKGRGVPVDKVKAAQLHGMSACQGNVNSMYNYPHMCNDG